MSAGGPVVTAEARAWLAGEMSTEDYFTWAYAKERNRAEAEVARAMSKPRRRWLWAS